ncbi:acyl-CoA dehydrogenase domain protein [Fibrella aestuarina BUZ 2]|uniref:Acyl-CoA dehydrogenase domain protein n=1 Tax=Fibrella aestuarina BUZ 2 TaxID=1166018 RepID=I0KH45_9BACT|nr:acyl-CoA dehydrogenase family protein [Fibrella aestuarina]CCH03448.1 acyl-CoA dehydrogenase domain protein [Fibrella aestuarina BUZ 2]
MEPIFATDHTRALIPRIRDFIQHEIIPLETTEHLTGNFSTVARLLDQKRELVKKAGLWGLQHSMAEGGLGLSLCEFGQISEVLAYSPFGHYTFNCQAPDIGNMELLHKYAPEHLKQTYLEPLKAGHIRSCFSMTEPEFAGSNPTQLGTLAEQQGDEWVINGHKWFTSSADGAAFAVVMAVTNPDAAPHKRASMILVPTDTPGFELVRNISIMGDPSDHWGSHAEVRYTNCRVPLSNLIGGEGLGFTLAQERLGPGRIHHCMRWIGIAERCFDLMCRRAATREVEPGVMLGEKQFIQGFIAESRAEIDASRLMVLRTAHNIDEQGAAAVRNEISTIKFFVANMMLRVVDRAIQVHGALGVTDDVLLGWYYRHERGARIYDGADEVHKTALARSILKGYGLDTRKKVSDAVRS